MKKYIKNVILVMSGGIGSRFGADCPKQYCHMNGRMVIDYVIDACRKTKNVDQIIIVATGEYLELCKERYGVPTIGGGIDRPDSVANGIKFIYENYDCEKLIITNAVCPLATSAQYDKYFNLLNDYDYVLTTWKLAPALHKLDGTKVDRDDYFNVMEPDAYNFKMLYDNFDFKNKKKYIFHNMPDESKAYYCFDYPYTMKLTYPHDIKLLKVLYDDVVVNPDNNKTLQTVNKYLSASYDINVEDWIINVQENIRKISQKYSMLSYTINNQTEANIVYEGYSNVYGDIIVKFTPNSFFYRKELLYYKYAGKGIMADLIGFDDDYNVIIIKAIKPGIQVKFNTENPEIMNFFDKVNEEMVLIENVEEASELPTVIKEFDEYAVFAGKYTYEYDFRKSMERKAHVVWNRYFENAPKYFLHRDLHKRNLLMSNDNIIAIDPRGAIGPRAFEYVIPFIIELRENTESFDYKKYNQMFDLFSSYVGKTELKAALFIFWVYKMNDYVFQKNDNNKLASWCKWCILDLFFDENDDAMNDATMPRI